MTMEKEQRTDASPSDHTSVTELEDWIRRMPAREATERIKKFTREAMQTGSHCRGDAFARSDVIVLRAAESEPLCIPVSALPCIVGRDPTADRIVEGRGLSRHHCRFERESVFVRVRDLGSTNGTHLNGKRIETEFLREGDRITIGEATFVVERQ